MEKEQQPRVEFGATEVEGGKWQPFIAFTTHEGGRVEFKADKLCPDQEHAGVICRTVYMILTGPQDNLVFS
jgi:hypothetical protein